MSKKLTQEEADIRVSLKCMSKKYILLESFIYINNKTLLHLKCSEDGHDWWIRYDNFITGNKGCPCCNERNKFLTHKEAYENVGEKCVLLGHTIHKETPYIGQDTIFELKCNECKTIWPTSYVNYIGNTGGCNVCGNKRAGDQKRRSQEDVNIKVQEQCATYDYMLVNETPYIGAHKTIYIIRCNKDKCEWPVTYSNFINKGSCCPQCDRDKRGHIPDHMLSDWKKYRRYVNKYTDRNKKHILKNWDGYDYYCDKEYIKDNFNLHYNHSHYPTIDHKDSIHYCFMNGISAEMCASINNLCVTKRCLNSEKQAKTEEQYRKRKGLI